MFIYFAASAWLALGADFPRMLPWKTWFFIPVAVYLLSCFIKGFRFAVLFKEKGLEAKDNLAAALPYQEAYALNNATVFYFSDLFIYWFYKPFVHTQRLLGAVALCRAADTIFLGTGFLLLSYRSGGLWTLFAVAILVWGGLCFAFLLFKRRGLLKRKFLPVLGLSFLGWVLEWLSLSLMFFFHRGGGGNVFTVGLENLFKAFLLGPQPLYHWLFLVHFAAGFASLLLLSYSKNDSKNGRVGD